jgi:ankyrin repeat protein
MKIVIFCFLISLNLFAFGLNQVLKAQNLQNDGFIKTKDMQDVIDMLQSYSFNDIKTILLNHKELLSETYPNRENLLHLAVKYRRYNLINFLVKNNLDVAKQNSNGNTPLHIAIYNEDLNAVGLLMLSKSFTKALGKANFEFLTPIELAKRSKNADIKAIFTQEDKTKPLQNITNTKSHSETTQKRSIQSGNNHIYIGN